jgi:hypothetical protein
MGLGHGSINRYKHGSRTWFHKWKGRFTITRGCRIFDATYVTPCNLVERYQRSRGTHCLHLQDKSWRRWKHLYESTKLAGVTSRIGPILNIHRHWSLKSYFHQFFAESESIQFMLYIYRHTG